jgi:prepilin-type N-terminal cleavage/methylation domain-containing protein
MPQVTQQKGFTLMELLTVIAIIGILASITVASLSSVRARSRISNAKSSMETVRAAAALCLFRSQVLTTPPVANAEICTGSNLNWPKLPGAWVYGAVSSNVSAQTFSITATGDSTTITCAKAAGAEAACS